MVPEAMGTKKQQARGLFITLEGGEGSGKSTHIRHLAEVLTQAGYRVLQTREPGGTATAEAIRHILLTASSQEPITPQAEALLILAARCQHVTHLIRPALHVAPWCSATGFPIPRWPIKDSRAALIFSGCERPTRSQPAG